MEIDDLKTMSDMELDEFFDEVRSDLKKAAEEQPESEWHQSCFAAALIVADEINSRKAKH